MFDARLECPYCESVYGLTRIDAPLRESQEINCQVCGERNIQKFDGDQSWVVEVIDRREPKNVMATQQLRYYDNVDLSEGMGSIEVSSLGNDRYRCFFCAPKDAESYQTKWFGILDSDNVITSFPEKNGYLQSQRAIAIWKQIKERYDNPDMIKE